MPGHPYMKRSIASGFHGPVNGSVRENFDFSKMSDMAIAKILLCRNRRDASMRRVVSVKGITVSPYDMKEMSEDFPYIEKLKAELDRRIELRKVATTSAPKLKN